MQNPSEYAVAIETTASGYSVYVPDLPGCVTVGESHKEAFEMIAEAIEMHIQPLREHGEAVPFASTLVGQMSVNAA